MTGEEYDHSPRQAQNRCPISSWSLAHIKKGNEPTWRRVPQLKL